MKDFTRMFTKTKIGINSGSTFICCLRNKQKKKHIIRRGLFCPKKKRGEDCNIDSYLILVQYRNSTRVTCNVKLTPISKDPMDIPTAEA